MQPYHGVSSQEELEKKKKIRNYELKNEQTKEQKEAELAWVREEVYMNTIYSLVEAPKKYQKEDNYWYGKTNVVFKVPEDYKRQSDTYFQHQDKADMLIEFARCKWTDDESERESIANYATTIPHRWTMGTPVPERQSYTYTYKDKSMHAIRFDYTLVDGDPWVTYLFLIPVDENWIATVVVSSSPDNVDELIKDVNYLIDNATTFEPTKELQEAVDNYYKLHDPHGDRILDPSQLPEELR